MHGCRALLCALAVALTLAGAQGAQATDMTKALRVAFPIAENGFDPQAAYDSYSFYVIGAIFDPLYVYDYFARPARMIPNTAAALPEVSDQGRTYTIKVRPGIRFAADPAFKGKPREFTAEDYVYSFKRILDPKVRSYWLYLFEGNLAASTRPLAAARKSGTWNYDAPLEGLARARPLHAADPFQTTELRLRVVARIEPALGGRARSGGRVQGRGEPGDGESGGRGPIPAEAMDARPTHPARSESGLPGRDVSGAGAGSEPGDAAIAQGLTGRKLPLVGNVDISIIEEAQPRLLSFESGGLDYVSLPATLSTNVLDGATLKPEYVKRGITLHRHVTPSVAFFDFNLENPLVGGYAPEKLALRRAISMGYDRDVAISSLAHGQALEATQPVPPALYGHDPKYVAPYGYDPRAARALLDKFGYKDRDGDGYRELPDGKPLTLVLASTPDNAARANDELWKKNMDAIGLRITFLKNKWPELNKMSEAGQLMMWGLVDQLRAGRQRLLQLLLQQEHRHVERRAHAAAGFRRPVRQVARPAARCGADEALRRDERHDLRLRAVDHRELCVRELPRAALAQGIQAESVRAASMALLRCRSAPALSDPQCPCLLPALLSLENVL